MQNLLTLLAVSLATSGLSAQDKLGERVAETGADVGAGFVFEGPVDYVDPVLRQDIGPPQVLAGTLELLEMAGHPPHLVVTAGVSTYDSAIGALEFTLDRNYVVNAEGELSSPPTENRVAISDSEPREGYDEIVVSASTTGPPLDFSSFAPSRLELYLRDESGVMLPSAELFETAPEFQAGSFVLHFVKPETGETAQATGTLTVFANWQREVTPEEDYRMLEEQIRELDAVLHEKEALIGNLQTELANVRNRLSDAAAEQTTLEAQNAELAAENQALKSGEAFAALREANEALRQELDASQDQRSFNAGTVAQMTVRQEFLARDNAELAQTNAQLRRELADSLADVLQIRADMEALRQQAQDRLQRNRAEASFNYPLVKVIAPPPQPEEPKSAVLSPLSIPPTPQNARAGVEAAKLVVPDNIPVVGPPEPTTVIGIPTATPPPEEDSENYVRRRGPRR